MKKEGRVEHYCEYYVWCSGFEGIIYVYIGRVVLYKNLE